MADRPMSLRWTALFVVLILVVAGVGGYFLYQHDHPSAVRGARVVRIGDNVTVNYIGVFGSGAEKGRVFDTSILADAQNNVSWPKSLEYTFRTNKSEYVPLGVHVGADTPSSGYKLHNVTFGGVVTGFWRGLVGLPGNVTRTIIIPPAQGYGALNQSCLVNAPLVVQVPVVETIESARFATLYPNVTKAAGIEFSDPTYHWTDLVLSVNSTSVSVENLPPLGFTATSNGWPITVSSIAGGTITVTNDIAPAQAGLLLGHSTTSVCSSKQFIVSAVDSPSGTYTKNYNKEVVGQTLVFIVTVVDIYP